jgi:hypothetical protein
VVSQESYGAGVWRLRSNAKDGWFFTDVSDRLGLTQPFFSFVKGLTLLEGMIHPNWRSSSPIGSTVNWSPIPQSIQMTSIPVGLLTMRVVDYFALRNLIGPIQSKWNIQNPEKNHSHITSVKAGIRDRADGYVVTDLSFPAFVYEKYTAKLDDLEDGLFKGKLLLQVWSSSLSSLEFISPVI